MHTAMTESRRSPPSHLIWLGVADSRGRRRKGRPCLPIPCWLIDEDGDAVADRLRVDEPQRLFVARVAEEALARPEDDGEDHQPQLVNEVVFDQRLHELGAAVDDE